MVALSKLLVGALVQSAYGSQQVDSAALKKKVTATITHQDCDYEKDFGSLTVNRYSSESACTINGVGIKDYMLHIRVNCSGHETFTVKDNKLELASDVKVFSINDDKIVVGETETDFKNGTCIKVELPPQDNETYRKHYQIKIPLFDPDNIVDDNTYGQVASLVMPNGKTVPNSAFFGTNGGEWDILDLVGIVAACVLVCCLGLALYGCWSKKKKEEAEQRQTKYVAQNSNPSGRTGTQRRRR